MRLERIDRSIDQRSEVNVLTLDLDNARLNATDVEHVVQQSPEPVRLILDDSVELIAGLVICRLTVHEHLHIRMDRRKRCAQLVTGLGDEIRLHLRDLALAGNIVENGHNPCNLVFVILHARQRDVEDPPLFAACTGFARIGGDVVLDVPAMSEVCGLGGILDQLAEAVIVHELLEGLVKRLSVVEAEESSCRLIGNDNIVERVRDQHPVSKGV